jgi:hypothetical protein
MSEAINGLSQRKEIFKAAGFNDLNQSGAIEKEAFDNCWRREGYIDQADINKDGKIDVVEAKYYLSKLGSVKPEIKQRFSITENERIILHGLLMEKHESIVENGYKIAKVYELGELAVEMQEAGFSQKKVIDVMHEAKAEALAQEEGVDRRNALSGVIFYMGKAGMNKESEKIVEMLQDSSDMDEAYKMIVDRYMDEKLFNDAIRVSDKLNNSSGKAVAKSSIARRMSSLGMHREASKVADTIGLQNVKNGTLLNIKNNKEAGSSVDIER